MISFCSSLEIACTVIVVIAILLPLTPSWLDNTKPSSLQPTELLSLIYIYISSKRSWLPSPLPPHCPLWSEILTVTTQSLSMKGQLFPNPLPACSGCFRCSIPRPSPPAHTQSHKHTRTHTQSQGSCERMKCHYQQASGYVGTKPSHDPTANEGCGEKLKCYMLTALPACCCCSAHPLSRTSTQFWRPPGCRSTIL